MNPGDPNCFSIWDIGKKYSTLTATCIIREKDKGSKYKGAFYIYGDEKLLYKSEDISSMTKPFPISIDISGVTDLKLEMYGVGNNGFYALLVVIVVFIIVNRKDYKYLFICLIIPLLFVKIITGPMYHSLNIKVDKKQTIKEMSSVPGQQLARAYYKHIKTFGKNDKKEFAKYYGNLTEIEFWAERHPSISDDTKRRLKIEKVQENPIAYILFWQKIGLKYPMDYTESFLLQNLGLIYPFKRYYDPRMYHPLIEYRSLADDEFKTSTEYYTAKSYPKLKEYNKYIQDYIEKYEWQSIPFVSLLNNLAFYFMFTIFSILFLLYNKKYKLLFPMCIIIGLYLTLLLSPVSLYRYSFPIICSIPLCLYLVIYSNKKEV